MSCGTSIPLFSCLRRLLSSRDLTVVKHESRPDNSPLQHQPFRLLDLPAELRELIYEHALIAPSSVGIYYSNASQLGDPPLAYVSRQIRSECLPIFYSVNTFETPFHQAIFWFLTKIDIARLPFLKCVRYTSAVTSLAFPIDKMRPFFEECERLGMSKSVMQVAMSVEGKGTIFVSIWDVERFEEVHEVAIDGQGKLFRMKEN